MAKVKLICSACDKEFDKEIGEYNRRKRLGRPIYCGLSCAGKVNLKNIPLEERSGRLENLIHDNWRDEYSPFRYFIKCMKNKSKKSNRKRCKVTVEDVKKQWDKQKGICPYTGWELLIPETSAPEHQVPLVPKRASVDRIDSSKPYTPDNIQFVATIAQYAKHIWHGDELLRFAEAVVEHHG